ncbi:Clp protease N-terminal domain-containing protein [Kitasatospora purpeofusca]|uniref:Clp protease N-terminal domain-containing protein n=1 Tax=Kitasatospora purpeofusca TaxID=67352 RepID=UPI0035DB506F
MIQRISIDAAEETDQNVSMIPMSLHQLIAILDSRSLEASPLDRIAEAQRYAHEMNDLGSALIGHYIDQARKSGDPRAREAAHEHEEGAKEAPASPQFKNPLDDVLDTAQQQALDRGHNETDTGHLLIALTYNEAAAAALESVGTSPEAVRSAVEERWAAKTWSRHPVLPGEFPAFGLDAGQALRPADGAAPDTPVRLLLAILACLPPAPGREALHALGLTSRAAARTLSRSLAK